MELTELQFKILDGMADDYEDIEQLYLYANRNFDVERRLEIALPLMVIGLQFPLHDVIDELRDLLRDGLVEAKYSNDEKVAPVSRVDSALLHHYWFGATEKGWQAWKARSAAP